MIKTITRLIRGPQIKMNMEEAEELAKQACFERGCEWLEPVCAKLSRGVYSFWTNFGVRGNNYWVKIDAEKCCVISSGVTNR